jgi:hypothetical protein
MRRTPPPRKGRKSEFYKTNLFVRYFCACQIVHHILFFVSLFNSSWGRRAYIRPEVSSKRPRFALHRHTNCVEPQTMQIAISHEYDLCQRQELVLGRKNSPKKRSALKTATAL